MESDIGIKMIKVIIFFAKGELDGDKDPEWSDSEDDDLIDTEGKLHKSYYGD